jgi:hypothetical protein
MADDDVGFYRRKEYSDGKLEELITRQSQSKILDLAQTKNVGDLHNLRLLIRRLFPLPLHPTHSLRAYYTNLEELSPEIKQSLIDSVHRYTDIRKGECKGSKDKTLVQYVRKILLKTSMSFRSPDSSESKDSNGSINLGELCEKMESLMSSPILDEMLIGLHLHLKYFIRRDDRLLKQQPALWIDWDGDRWIDLYRYLVYLMIGERSARLLILTRPHHKFVVNDRMVQLMLKLIEEDPIHEAQRAKFILMHAHNIDRKFAVIAGPQTAECFSTRLSPEELLQHFERSRRTRRLLIDMVADVSTAAESDIGDDLAGLSIDYAWSIECQ